MSIYIIIYNSPLVTIFLLKPAPCTAYVCFGRQKSRGTLFLKVQYCFKRKNLLSPQPVRCLKVSSEACFCYFFLMQHVTGRHDDEVTTAMLPITVRLMAMTHDSPNIAGGLSKFWLMAITLMYRQQRCFSLYYVKMLTPSNIMAVFETAFAEKFCVSHRMGTEQISMTFSALI